MADESEKMVSENRQDIDAENFIFPRRCGGIIFFSKGNTEWKEKIYYRFILNRFLANGEIAEYVNYWEEILAEIEYSEEEDVIIYREEIKANNFIRDIDLPADKDYEMNIGIAQYYGKKLVYVTTDI